MSAGQSVIVFATSVMCKHDVIHEIVSFMDDVMFDRVEAVRAK